MSKVDPKLPVENRNKLKIHNVQFNSECTENWEILAAVSLVKRKENIDGNLYYVYDVMYTQTESNQKAIRINTKKIRKNQGYILRQKLMSRRNLYGQPREKANRDATKDKIARACLNTKYSDSDSI